MLKSMSKLKVFRPLYKQKECDVLGTRRNICLLFQMIAKLCQMFIFSLFSTLPPFHFGNPQCSVCCTAFIMQRSDD